MATIYNPPFDKDGNLEFDSPEWSSDSVSVTYPVVTTGSGSGWSYPLCSTCNSSPCTCNSVVVTSPGFTIGEPDTGLADLVEKLSICQVCGAEDSFVLCSVCVEAVKLARNRWLDEFRKEIASLVD